MLDRFRQSKQREVQRLMDLEAAGLFPQPLQVTRPGFAHALQAHGPDAVIAEYKPASPSRGVINPGLSPSQAGSLFQAGGAAAVSVLTEEDHFQSSLDNLFALQHPGLPLLRKDFIIDPVQVRHTAATPASALLVIVRMFQGQSGLLRRVFDLTLETGLEPVVEVFDARDLERARELGARLIQVNNRDLDTLKVSLETSRTLVQGKSVGETWICASGISTRDQIVEMSGLGFDGFLVGTTIMASDSPLQTLQSLTGRERTPC